MLEIKLNLSMNINTDCNIKLIYMIFILTMSNMSSLLLMFIAVPLVTTCKHMSFMSLMLSYIYLGVIIMFIMMGIMMLNIKMNLMMNPIMLMIFLSLYSQSGLHKGYVSFNSIVMMFIVLLMLMYMMSNLLMYCYM